MFCKLLIHFFEACTKLMVALTCFFGCLIFNKIKSTKRLYIEGLLFLNLLRSFSLELMG